MIGPIRNLGEQIAKGLRPQAAKAEDVLAKSALDEQAVAKALGPSVDRLVTTQAPAAPFSPNTLVTLNSDVTKLMAFIKTGKLQTDEAASVAIGNVNGTIQTSRRHAAVVLTPEGQRKVAVHVSLESMLDEWNTRGYGRAAQLPQSLELEPGDISQILVPELRYKGLAALYQRTVAKNEAPALIAGKPFTEVFRSSDDLMADLEVEAFKNAVPGFAKRALVEQRSVAALAGRAARLFPKEVSEETRRRVAAELVLYRTAGDGVTGKQLSGQLKQYYHGTNAGEAIAQSGALKPGSTGLYGKGVYYGNPSVAAGYGDEIVTGKVAVGRLTTRKFNWRSGANTRFVKDAGDVGEYWVTKDPKRFNLEAIASFRPGKTEGFDKLLPDLMRAYQDDPAWAFKYLQRVEPERLQRAIAHALEQGEPNERIAAMMLQARMGNTQGFQTVLNTLKNGPTAETRAQAGKALVLGLDDVSKAGLDQQPFLEALLASSDASVRRKVGVYLVKQGDVRGVSHAIDAFKNAPSLQERQGAMNLLFEALERPRTEAIEKQQSVIGEALLTTSDPAFRRQTSFALLEQGDTSDEVLAIVQQALRDGIDRSTAETVVFRRLQALGPERAKERSVLLDLLLDPQVVNDDLVESIAQLGEPRGLRALLERTLKEADPGRRASLTKTLLDGAEKVAPERAQEKVALFEAMLKEPELKPAANIGLLKSGDERGISGALESLRSKNAGEQRDAAFALLGALDGLPQQGPSRETILQALLAAPAEIRQNTGYYLLARGDRRGLEAGLEALRNTSDQKMADAIAATLKTTLKTLGPDELPTAQLILKDLLPHYSGKDKAEVWQVVSERFGEDATRALKPGWRDVVRGWF